MITHASPQDRLSPCEALARDCVDCGICAKNCAFLQRHGGARELARSALAGSLPPGCRTVFSPGCGLPGTRPGRMLQVLDLLRQHHPDLVVVLDCCHKPSHDLGREGHVDRMFSPGLKFLIKQGVRRVLTACPNCQRMFSTLGGNLESLTVYEELGRLNWQPPETVEGVVTIHDPYGVRMRRETHGAVRELTARLGLAVEEMVHCREKTVCCGEGGSAPYVAPDLARAWTSLRVREAAQRRVMTYCAGCAGFLGRRPRVVHLLDALFMSRKAMAGRVFVARPPLTSLNRLVSKYLLRRRFAPARIGQRQDDGGIAFSESRR